MATIASFPVAGRSPDDLAQRLDEAIARAQARLLGLQHRDGYWHAPLEANVGMDAQYVIFNRFMGRRRQETEHRLVGRMQAVQSADGSWPLYHGGPGHLSTTIEAYFAMKLAGVPIDDPALARAREFIRAHGGLERAGVFTRTFLAYFGQFPWWGLPAMPVELVLLPPWFPLNIYAMSSWARETVVPLTVLMAEQPHRTSRRSVASRSCGSRRRRRSASVSAQPRVVLVRNACRCVVCCLERLGLGPWKSWRACAIRRSTEWSLARQDRNGGWGGIQPPMLNCVMALRALGYPDDHPAVANGVQAIEDFLIEHDGQLFFQPCVSPTWDTALTCKALRLGGPRDASRAGARRRGADREPDRRAWRLERSQPAARAGRLGVRVRQRLVSRHRRQRGDPDGAAADRGAGPGRLPPRARARHQLDARHAEPQRRVGRLRHRQHRRVPESHPVRRHGGDDRPAHRGPDRPADGADGQPRLRPPATAAPGARTFLLRTQRADGSWWGAGGATVYGTWSVLAGLRAIGETPDAPHVRRAVAWLHAHQNADLAGGETLRIV